MTGANNALRVREGHAADAEWIARAQVAMARETEGMELEIETVRRGVAHMFESPGVGAYVVAEDRAPDGAEDGAIVGCLLTLREWSDWRAGDVWWIHSVYVAPERRRDGVFSAMFDHVRKMARDAGARGLRLYVDKTNTGAQATYHRMGMTNEHYEMFELMF